MLAQLRQVLTGIRTTPQKCLQILGVSATIEHVIESEFAAKAAQLHALAGELAAAVSADTSGILATEVLPEVLGRCARASC